MRFVVLPSGRPYAEVLGIQFREFSERIACRRDGRPLPGDVVFFVEHGPVYTLGRRGLSSHLLLSEADLRARGIEFVEIGRGGDITYHGPGQLTVYPVLDLQRLRLGVKDYVALLEDVVIESIARFGIRGGKIPGRTGVWIGKGTPAERKISAIGSKCSRFVSMHGFALNVGPDLSPFSGIVPCGLSQGVTSVSAETGRVVSIDEVMPVVAEVLSRRLNSGSPPPRILSQENS